MRTLALLAFAFTAVPARAQNARVTVPVNVPGASGVTGAVGAVPGAPAGAPALVPAANLLGPASLTPAPAPVMLAPLTGKKAFSPVDGRAGAAQNKPVRAESLSDSAPNLGLAPSALSRRDMVPPEQGELAPAAMSPASKHAAVLPADASRGAAAAPATGFRSVASAVNETERRLRLAAPWL
ncbi:MAG: hypothetical protein HY925_06100, partial [Elusimicrobia bacterium]|nr:hypothetical protein [Elusimicrobiota bacterium]